MKKTISTFGKGGKKKVTAEYEYIDKLSGKELFPEDIYSTSLHVKAFRTEGKGNFIIFRSSENIIQSICLQHAIFILHIIQI
ncbi:hypothetical protein [Jeotgalibacillus soli]|nr:hypothetical protein [Jeotgalibacillus soli]